MKVWIDTEFNDFRGELISMALVAEDGREFYEVLDCLTPSPWVAENVMPILHKAPVARLVLQKRLFQFLMEYDDVHLIADWPEDIAHFCNTLITGPGQRIGTPPLTLEIRRDMDDAVSAIPHNALEDARSLRDEYLRLMAI